VVRELIDGGAEEFFLMPLYPHYAMSSFETVVVKAMNEIRAQEPDAQIDLLQPFYKDPQYIDALVRSAEPHLEDPYDKLLFSFHGIPERHLRKTDPSHSWCLSSPDCCGRPHPAHATCYRHQCFETVRAFVERAGIPEEKFAVSFQSRLGNDPWLSPYTDFELERLAKEGVKHVRVMCPAFVSDCLETLEEIAMEGKETFLENGGESFRLVPCLNDHAAWVDFLVDRIQGWSGRGES
jgi:ferrochelatase